MQLASTGERSIGTVQANDEPSVNKSPMRLTTADRRLRIAVVGLNFGLHLVRDLLGGSARSDFELVAVCDQDANRLGMVASEAGVVALQNLNDVLARHDID